jgi:hypothetical protein
MRGFGLLSMARCESFIGGPICPNKWADGLKPLLESLSVLRHIILSSTFMSLSR